MRSKEDIANNPIKEEKYEKREYMIIIEISRMVQRIGRSITVSDYSDVWIHVF